jgi:hypothetical protein
MAVTWLSFLSIRPSSTASAGETVEQRRVPPKGNGSGPLSLVSFPIETSCDRHLRLSVQLVSFVRRPEVVESAGCLFLRVKTLQEVQALSSATSDRPYWASRTY